MNTRRSFVAACLAVSFLTGAQAAFGSDVFDPTPTQQEAFIETLKTPGHILLLRHALAPGHSDPADFSLGQCGTQRNLDAVGRAQAGRIGDWLRERGFGTMPIYSSQFCRCLDTASLMELGQVHEEPALNAMSHGASLQSEKLQALEDFSARFRQAGEPAVWVTHSSIIAKMMGGMLGSGEGAVIRIEPDGSTVLIGRVLFDMPRH